MTAINDGITMKGRLHIVQRNEFGDIVDERRINNLVVQVGKNFIASRMLDASAAVMSHMAVGTDGTAAASGNTALGGEVAASRVAVTPSRSANVNTYSAVFGAGVGTGALQEAGIFNASSAGTMLARATFPVLNKGASDTVTISWSVTIG